MTLEAVRYLAHSQGVALLHPFFKYALRLLLKAHWMVLFYFYINFCGILPGRELNLGCWDRIPACYHFATPTPYNTPIIGSSLRIVPEKSDVKCLDLIQVPLFSSNNYKTF